MSLHKYELELLGHSQTIEVEVTSVHPHDFSVAWVANYGDGNVITIAVYSRTLSRIDIVTELDGGKVAWLMDSLTTTVIPKNGKCETVWTSPDNKEKQL